MENLDIVFKAGRSAVELALFAMLPIMVVMLCLLRLLEARGVLDWLVRKLAPVMRPFGLTGLSVFAALQVNFVSGLAPVATLAIMEQRGTSDRHLAATLAMVFAMAQGNVTFTMAAMGLHFGQVFFFAVLGGLVAAGATYYLFGRSLDGREAVVDTSLQHPSAVNANGVLDVINRAGAEALRIAVGSLPMLVLSLVAVSILRVLGVIDWLTVQLSPLLVAVRVDPSLILPTLTKYLAGGTAMLGVVEEMRRSGLLEPQLINQSAGWLIHPFDVPGVAILITAGRRVASVWRPAALGACVGIAVRTVGHLVMG